MSTNYHILEFISFTYLLTTELGLTLNSDLGSLNGFCSNGKIQIHSNYTKLLKLKFKPIKINQLYYNLKKKRIASGKLNATTILKVHILQLINNVEYTYTYN